MIDSEVRNQTEPVLADYLLKKTIGQTYLAEDQFDFSVILPNKELEHFNVVSFKNALREYSPSFASRSRLKTAERSEAKNAKRSFASNDK